uniref:Uncharacterized protein n=1 Tax=Anopheles minimus TaxID=112268 RepID=A0A182WNJ2_9DIPT
MCVRVCHKGKAFQQYISCIETVCQDRWHVVFRGLNTVFPAQVRNKLLRLPF